MTREEIIQGLKFTVDMFLFDPTTGETYTEPQNDMDKITIDACRGAIELLEQKPVLEIKTVKNAKEAEAYPISENITKRFEEFTKMMIKQGQAESEVENENRT